MKVAADVSKKEQGARNRMQPENFQLFTGG